MGRKYHLEDGELSNRSCTNYDVHMLEIVDREREISELRRLAANPPALAILRGRRRVGKTFLLRVALTGERVVQFQAEEQPRALQLAALAREFARLLPGEPPLSFADWGEFLRSAGEQASAAGPLTLVLDEFQDLVAGDPGLPSAIQRAWDDWDARRVPVTLMLCGSAISFMEGLLSASSPTFGRSVFRPLLLPLTYRDSAGFAAPGTPAERLIERFAVLGGTPQYQKWAGPAPIDRIIERTILPPDAPLHSDPEHLVRQEEGVREPGPYLGALQAIADGYTTPSAIGGRLEMKQQLVGHFLSRLEDLGYAARVEPLQPGERGRGRAYWKIRDPYFRFWFRYVLPNRSRLAMGRIGEVAAEIHSDLPTFVGPVFEDCCREWVGRYSSLGDGALKVASWWSRRNDVEIDVAAVGKSRYLLLGSCKWRRRPVGEDVLDELYEARASLGPAAARARLAIFARAGFSPALLARATAENVRLVEAAELFE